MSEQLFSSFDSIDAKQWKQQIQFELKGLDYNETLVWESLEGIKVKPFYTKEDLPNDNQTLNREEKFKILQEVYVNNASNANHVAKTKIEKGAESICFIFHHPIDLNILLNDLPKEIPYFFNIQFDDDLFLKDLIAFSKEKLIMISYDPISNLIDDGNWFKNKEHDFKNLNHLVTENNHLFIDASLYQESGANGVQQIGLIAAHLTEYLNQLIVKPQMLFIKWRIGSHYFFEIAKLRALRLIIETLLNTFDCQKTTIQIIAQPIFRNKTLYDYNVNMLRTTTEYMSAILGGADYVMPLAYDAIYHKSNPFGDRIARNQLLILKHESYFDEVLNPADGSYYIESLTQTFAEKALAYLKNIEKNGGLIKELFDKTIQVKIEESAEKEQKWFDEGKIILLGTNKYPNQQDKMKNDLELYPFMKVKPRKTIIKPLVAKRLAEGLEKERLEKE